MITFHYGQIIYRKNNYKDKYLIFKVYDNLYEVRRIIEKELYTGIYQMFLLKNEKEIFILKNDDYILDCLVSPQDSKLVIEFEYI